MPSSLVRKVKIVCTLGPASCSRERIRDLIDAGMDVARLNFSHGAHSFHKDLITLIREAALQAGRTVAIMQDLQGPKLRAGKLDGGRVELKAGDRLLLFPEGKAPSHLGKGRIPIPISAEIARAVARDVKKGARILFDDGKIATRAEATFGNPASEIDVLVEVGGVLTNHKGMNLPGTPLSIPSLTAKDELDLKFGLEQEVDGIALSFVRSPADIELVQSRIRKVSKVMPFLIAKMEREEAVEKYESIIEVADGILVARGDMAVELGAEHVPIIQKRLIHACNQLGVPVITATQMLESMVNSPMPTRAEASDVANAVFDGTDAVMLSAETASGSYPVESVQTMAKIILESEKAKPLFDAMPDVAPMPGSVVDTIEFSAARIAQDIGAVAIACLTHSGTAARSLAKYRPLAPIVAIMPDEAMMRRLCFTWGIRAVHIPKLQATDDLFATVEKLLVKNHCADVEDTVVITAGIPSLRKGTTNMVKVHRIGTRR
ncbi:MAG: pyruvate kinase [Bdellovibrionota bacterium]